MPEERRSPIKSIFSLPKVLAKGVVDAVLGPEPSTQKKFDVIEYKDLFEFACACQKKNPDVVFCLVVCRFDDEAGKFQLTQLMLDKQKKAIEKKDGYFGRVVYTDRFDEMIRSFNSENSLAWEFDFSVGSPSRERKS